MTSKQGRRLPEWYSEKVKLADVVFRGAPEAVNMAMPKIMTRDSGAGIAAQRQGLMTNKQPGVDLDDGLGVAGQGHGLDLLEG